MKYVSNIISIMKKEFFHILRDKALFSIIVIAPLLMSAIVSGVYIKHKTVEIPIVVYDQSKSDLSRMIIRSFDDSERLNVVENVESYSEMKEWLDSEKAYTAIVIPEDLKEKIKSGRSTDVAIIINGTNILITNTVATSTSQIVQTISSSITLKIIEGTGVSKKKAYEAVTAINFRSRTWYNPTTSYLFFMILGLIGTIMQQTIFLGTAISIVKERERGSWNMLVLAGLKWYELFIGKFLVYFLIFSIDMIILYYYALNILNVPMIGSAGLFFITMLLFCAVIIFLGMIFSIIVNNSIQAIQYAMIIAVPSFMLSGFTWPIFAMPDFIQKISYSLPLTYFLNTIKMQSMMGAGYDYCKDDLKALLLFMIFAGLIAALGISIKYKTE